MRYAARAIIVRNQADHQDNPGQEILLMRRNKFGKIYYILPGGGVNAGESPEQALYREIKEETGVVINNHQLVFMEDAGAPYGTQFIYQCTYVSGEPVLSPFSEESKIQELGSNLYEPMWVPTRELADSAFVSIALRDAIVRALSTGFPAEPVKI
jgi:8-oxo-dGTP diphosphatase